MQTSVTHFINGAYTPDKVTLCGRLASRVDTRSDWRKNLSEERQAELLRELGERFCKRCLARAS